MSDVIQAIRRYAYTHTDEAVKTVEHYIEGPRKPVLQEKQVFLVF